MKKNVLTIIIVGVVCLGVGIFGGFKYYEHIKNNQQNGEGTKIPDEKQYANSDKEEVKENLKRYFRNFGGCDTGIELDFSKKNKIYYEDLDEDVVYSILYGYVINNNLVTDQKEENEFGIHEKEFDKASFLKAMENIFGVSAREGFMLPKTFWADLRTFTLDEKTNKYISNTEPTGCDPGSNAYYLFNYDFTDNNTKFFLEFAYYYVDMVTDDEYETYDGAFNPKTNKYICKVNEIVYNLDKFEKYRYNFKLENNHFILDYIEKIK